MRGRKQVKRKKTNGQWTQFTFTYIDPWDIAEKILLIVGIVCAVIDLVLVGVSLGYLIAMY